MSVSSKIRTFINQHPNNYIPSTMEFNSIDIASLAKQLELEERGIERGKIEQPPSSSQKPDSVECEVTNTMGEERKKNYSNTLNQLHACEARLSALNLDDKISDINCLTNDAITEFKTQTNEGINELEIEKRRVKELYHERQKFRSINKLDRIARHPDSLTLYWAIIGILFILEWLTNGLFFSKGDPRQYFRTLG